MNLWNETIAVLKSNGKTFDDVLTICGNEFQITKDDFKKYANEYDEQKFKDNNYDEYLFCRKCGAKMDKE